MANEKSTINAVPTNIITGSLGAGKTTLIQSLLKQKPAHERWAVLVNEFGEVGIDRAILSAPQQTGIYIKEVPGGCMCCTSGLPMQIALNLLLQESKPDRLLIEPTGLGHPTEVLETLAAPHYRSVLALQATFTLIDAFKLRSDKWAEHPTFKEQIEIADVIVKTKTEAYTTNDEKNLDAYLSALNVKHIPVVNADTQSLSVSELSKPSRFLANLKCSQEHSHSHSHNKKPTLEIDTQLQTQPVIKVANHGQGFYSYGWICAPDRLFDTDIASDVFRSLNVERLKAVLLTDNGAASFNLSNDQLTTAHSSYRDDSRLEFICATENDATEACRIVEEGLSLFADQYEL